MTKNKFLLRRILPCLLVIIAIVTLASCKGCKDSESSTTSYPSQVPTINNPDGVFMQIGDYKITNQAVYNRLLLTYGLETLQDMIDEDITKDVEYDSHYSDEDFEKNLDEIIFGDLEDETERAEALEAFELGMRASGYFTEAAYKEFYKLAYKKMNFVVKAFKEEINEHNEENPDEPYYSEETLKNYYEQNNLPKVTTIIVTFDSEYQARQIMKNHGIDLTTLNANWTINGTAATTETIVKVFEDMYKTVTDSTEAQKQYTSEELAKLSSTISSAVYGLEPLTEETLTSSYTHAPLTYGSRYFLAINVAEDAEGIETFEETNKDDIVHQLVENTMTEDYITKIFGEKYIEMGVKFYDQGIETRFISQFSAAHASLGITEYEAFSATDEESSTVIASYTLNGENKEITAQQLFEKLVAQYGAALSLSLLQQYAVLANSEYNDVYDILTGEIKDQEKYDEYYKSDIQEYKSAFEAGDYAASGYPASYGWENFIRDYIGVTKESDILISLDSSLYKDAQDILAKTIWLDTKEVTDSETNETTTTPDDTRVQQEMEKIFNEFFSANIIGVYVFYDKDLDNIGDYYETPDVDTDASSAALLELIYDKAADKVNENKHLNKTLESALAEVVTEYKLANFNHSVWGEFKKAGLRATNMSSVSYTNSSSINEDLKANIKALWDKVVAIKDGVDKEGVESKVAKITGQSLDPGYRYEVENKQTDETTVHYATALDFTSDVFFTNNTGEEEGKLNIAYKISVTKATNAAYITQSKGIYRPAYSDYVKYIDGETLSSATKTAVTTYYVAAINNLLKIGNVSNAKTINKIIDECRTHLENTTWTVNSETIKGQLEILMQDTYTVAEAE